jgi:hypothetical protein
MCFSSAIVLSMLLWNVGHFLRGYTSSCSSPWEPNISPPWWLTDWHSWIKKFNELTNRSSWQDLWVTRHPLAGLVLTNAVEWGVLQGLVWKLPASVKPEGSLPYWQESASGPYPEPVESKQPSYSILIPKYWFISRPPSYVLHALPILSSFIWSF